MVNLTLSDATDITISVNTTVEDIVYEGGRLIILPNVALFYTGEFLFRPTTSDDPIGKIYGAFVARTAAESGYNGLFTNFRVYDLYPETEGLFFPCIVYTHDDGEQKITDYHFGGSWMEEVELVCDLAFKMNTYLVVDNDTLSGKPLAEHYLWCMRQVVNDIDFTNDVIKIGDFSVEESIHEPKNKNQTLYGFSLYIDTEYLKDD